MVSAFSHIFLFISSFLYCLFLFPSEPTAGHHVITHHAACLWTFTPTNNTVRLKKRPSSSVMWCSQLHKCRLMFTQPSPVLVTLVCFSPSIHADFLFWPAIMTSSTRRRYYSDETNARLRSLLDGCRIFTFSHILKRCHHVQLRSLWFKVVLRRWSYSIKSPPTIPN